MRPATATVVETSSKPIAEIRSTNEKDSSFESKQVEAVAVAEMEVILFDDKPDDDDDDDEGNDTQSVADPLFEQGIMEFQERDPFKIQGVINDIGKYKVAR